MKKKKINKTFPLAPYAPGKKVITKTVSLAAHATDQTFSRTPNVLTHKSTKTPRQIRPISSGGHKGRSWADYWTERTHVGMKVSTFCGFAAIYGRYISFSWDNWTIGWRRNFPNSLRKTFERAPLKKKVASTGLRTIYVLSHHSSNMKRKLFKEDVMEMNHFPPSKLKNEKISHNIYDGMDLNLLENKWFQAAEFAFIWASISLNLIADSLEYA